MSEECSCKEKLEKLRMYFKSGNDIPVERATILARDFWKIVNDDKPIESDTV